MASKKISFKDIKNNEGSTGSQLAEAFNTVKNTQPSKKDMMKVADVKLDPKGEFTKLFPLNQETVDKLAENMSQKGYYQDNPLILARFLDEPETGEILIDGHHRKAATEAAGIEEVPVYHHVFNTRRDGLIYAYELQYLRRNLDNAGMFKLFQQIDRLKNPGRKNDEEIAEGKSSAETAKLLGISERQVDKMRNIEKNGSEELKEQVLNGEVSINQADKKINKAKQTKSEDDEITDSLETNEGNPAPVQVHQRKEDDTEKRTAPTEDATDRIIQEKNIQIEAAKEEFFGKGFNTALFFILGEVIKGKTAKEIFTCELLQDLSPAVLLHKEFPKDNEDLVWSL